MAEGSQAFGMKQRLFLEEICSDILRCLHPRDLATPGRDIRIDHEWNLGSGTEFADIRVRPSDADPYFVEIKVGYTNGEVVRRLADKFSSEDGRRGGAQKVVVVLDMRGRRERDELVRAIRSAIARSLDVELWDEDALDALTQRFFGVRLPPLDDPSAVAPFRMAVDEAKARWAFGERSVATDRPLRDALLWRFGVSQLKELRGANAAKGLPETAESLVPMGHYERAIVLMADMSSFSSFVRDTPDEEITRASLTSFYAKSREQIIDSGGMFYQFVGDEVSAIFGVPNARPGYVHDALRAARALLEILRSVTTHWQRRIDRVQAHCAAHIGMAMGDLDLVALRPFDVARFGAFGDSLNIAARLLHVAAADEIIISNVLRQELDGLAYDCELRPETEIKNLGVVRSWRLIADAGARDRAGVAPGAH
ncbi:MAG TPA: adenylate/guanylate cyclase domain-containing protein [Candidatus Limnocylindria bacterium]